MKAHAELFLILGMLLKASAELGILVECLDDLSHALRELVGRNDITDEEIARPLVEHDLRRDTGVGTTEDDGERLLRPSRDTRVGRTVVTLITRFAGNKARIAFLETLQGLVRRDGMLHDSTATLFTWA